jgi:hypothetical protein
MNVAFKILLTAFAAAISRTVEISLNFETPLFNQSLELCTICWTEDRTLWLSDCRSFPEAANESVNAAKFEERSFEADGALGIGGLMVGMFN